MLHPVAEPGLAPFRAGSALHTWHVQIALRAWPVPAGQALSGSDNWNGKALVVGESSGLDRSVGEVEIAARLRGGGASAGWTGKPRAPWNHWALDPATRAGWVAEVDRAIRQENGLLAGNSRGRPDVLRWISGRDDFCCVEYKGPSPTDPTRPDTVKDEQEAWLETACRSGLLTAERIAVVTWRPTCADAATLRGQAAASRLGRSQRGGTFPPAA